MKLSTSALVMETDVGHQAALQDRIDHEPVQNRVHSYAILDTSRDTVFDRVVFTAAQLVRVPIAIIALIDGDRLWFKSQVGLMMPELPRSVAMCSMIEGSTPLVVEDTSRDQRFAENPLVTGPPHIRFYAAAPMITPDGLRIGSLCVADRSPKALLSRQTWQLAQLADSVVAVLESRRPTN